MIQVSELDTACSIVSQYYYCILRVSYHYITGLSYYRVGGCCVYIYCFVIISFHSSITALPDERITLLLY